MLKTCCDQGGGLRCTTTCTRSSKTPRYLRGGESRHSSMIPSHMFHVRDTSGYKARARRTHSARPSVEDPASPGITQPWIRQRRLLHLQPPRQGAPEVRLSRAWFLGTWRLACRRINALTLDQLFLDGIWKVNFVRQLGAHVPVSFSRFLAIRLDRIA